MLPRHGRARSADRAPSGAEVERPLYWGAQVIARLSETDVLQHEFAGDNLARNWFSTRIR